uniref:Vesicle-fusing ATPase n=1 Tax=Rhizophora mucronata TaxID=61149 RepID=A0A2P2MAS3_RHIMU
MASMRVTLVRSKKQNMYNRAYVNPESLELYREIRQNQRARCGAVGSEHGCALINDILAVQLHADGALRQNEIALNERQFKSAKTWKGCVVSVAKFELPNNIEMEALYVELQMPSGTPNRINARNLEEHLKKRFSGQIMHVGQEVQFRYNGVTGIYIVNRVIMGGNEDVSNGSIRGMLTGKTKIFFDPLTENPKLWFLEEYFEEI